MMTTKGSHSGRAKAGMAEAAARRRRSQRMVGFLLALSCLGVSGAGLVAASEAAEIVSSLPQAAVQTSPEATVVPLEPAANELVVDPTPMAFDFSTSVPPPEIAWRPPPYPAPWALSPTDHFYFAPPILSGNVNWPNPQYRYGNTYHGNMAIHAGVDISAARGTPVFAAGAGEVIWAGYGLTRASYDPEDPYGCAVAIRHDFGHQGQMLYTIYAHFGAATVWIGQRVEAGEMIGIVGDTGKTTGAHLHFEVRLGANNYYHTRNPELWIVPPEGFGVLAGRIEDSYGRPLGEHKLTVTSLETGDVYDIWTYAREIVNPDDIYGENFVISDLPAGPYEVQIHFYWRTYTTQILLNAGRTTVVRFAGQAGFIDQPSSAPESLSEPPF